jgi:hypothetical protein
MWAMASASDRARVILVAATAVAQAVTAPVTTWALGPSFNIGAISDANLSPVTPADYAFAVWGLIYAACIALAVYQLLPSQQERTVHRLTVVVVWRIHRKRTLGAGLRNPYALARPDTDRDLGRLSGLRRSSFPGGWAGSQHGGGSLASATGDDLLGVGDLGGGRWLCYDVPLVGDARFGTLGE